MNGLLQGIVGGAMVALLIWLVKIPRDVRTHDRLVRERDQDLDTWLADEKLRLDRELRDIMDRLAADNLIWSGHRLFVRAQAKERALHKWRDQERQAQRMRAELDGREEWAHRVWRRLFGNPLPPLSAPTKGKPLLDHWREPESYDGAPVLPVDDPTARTLEAAIDDLPEH